MAVMKVIGISLFSLLIMSLVVTGISLNSTKEANAQTCTASELNTVEKVKKQLLFAVNIAQKMNYRNFIIGIAKWVSGNDTSLQLDVAWLRSTSIIKTAEKTNELYFQIRPTGSGPNAGQSLLRTLDSVYQDGQPRTFIDYWDYAKETPLPIPLLRDKATQDFALTVGSFQLTSRGYFEISRVSNDMFHITGTVEHAIIDAFDFNPGQQFPPKWLSWLRILFYFPVFKNDELNLLMKCESASDYIQGNAWVRTVDITGNYLGLREMIRTGILPFSGP